jgi:hypothetical protein
MYSYKYICYIFVQFSWPIRVLHMAMYTHLILIMKRYQAISTVLVFKFDMSLRRGGCMRAIAFSERDLLFPLLHLLYPSSALHSSTQYCIWITTRATLSDIKCIGFTSFGEGGGHLVHPPGELCHPKHHHYYRLGLHTRLNWPIAHGFFNGVR